MDQDADHRREAHFRIKTASGEVEVTGPVNFVEQRWGDVQAALLRATEQKSAEPAIEFDGQRRKIEEKSTAPRSSTARGKRSGPSCASRISALIEKDFFSSVRRASDIGAKLSELATPYEAKHIAAALNHLTKTGKLRRLRGSDGDWNYVKP